MGAQAKKKDARGTENTGRRNRKAWKDGKPPEVRQIEAATRALAKVFRKGPRKLNV